MTVDFDIVVAGAGPVGLAFAASMAGTGLRVALADPQSTEALGDPADDGREIALTDRSVGMLTKMGAWARVPASDIAPLRRMQVLNGPSRYAMQFGDDGTGSVGRFVPNHQLRRALHSVVREQTTAIIFAGCSIASMRVEGDCAAAGLSDGRTLTARLVVAADTRRSALRQQQGISASLHDYQQRMLGVRSPIPCHIAKPRPHGSNTGVHS